MIGNDVVDLALAATESNWRRRGFLQKLFTENEQRHILSSASPGTTVWILWSKKESAYKIYNRESGNIAFNPLKFECCNFSEEITTVYGFGTIYFTTTNLIDEELHTVAVTDFADLAQIRISDFEPVLKKGRLPFLISTNGDHISCSVSHHGRYRRIVYIK